MGSDKREIIFYDNEQDLGLNECVNIATVYFQNNLPKFKFIRLYNDPHGYWGFYFSNGAVTIRIGSERSFLDYDLLLNTKSIALSEFDSRVNFLKATSKKNILFLLDVIKRYLSR